MHHRGMTRLLLVLMIGCSAKTQPPSGTASGSAPVAGTGSASAAETGSAQPRPYTGPPERGPCQDVHGCKLRDVCGCSCEAVSLSVPSNVDCDKSCDAKPCTGMSLICDLATQTCGAIPPIK